MEASGGAWERCVPVAVRAGDKAERQEELTLRLTLSPAKLPHSGRVRLARPARRAGRRRGSGVRGARRLGAARAICERGLRRAARGGAGSQLFVHTPLLHLRRWLTRAAPRAPPPRRRR